MALYFLKQASLVPYQVLVMGFQERAVPCKGRPFLGFGSRMVLASGLIGLETIPIDHRKPTAAQGPPEKPGRKNRRAFDSTVVEEGGRKPYAESDRAPACINTPSAEP